MENQSVRERLKQEIFDLLRSSFYLHENSDGTFTGEIYADYRDKMDRRTAIEICEDNQPMAMFDAVMDEWYDDCAWEYRNDVRREVARKLAESRPKGLTSEEESLLDEIMEECVYYNYPSDHYLKQEFYVNVMLDTGDANSDYVLNSVYPCWYGKYGARIDDKASIVWLARSQGYTKTQLAEALKEGDMVNPKGFLESMRVELANLPSHMSIVTFLVRMSLRDLISVNEALHYRKANGHGTKRRPNCGYMVVGKDTMTGLYSPWDGGGSVLEVELERDVKIPFSVVHSILPDGGEGRYSIENAYGMCGSAWRDTIKQVWIPQRVRDQF